MIEKASIYTMNALNMSSELWHTSVNHKARPVVEGEYDKSWNDHGFYHLNVIFEITFPLRLVKKLHTMYHLMKSFEKYTDGCIFHCVLLY